MREPSPHSSRIALAGIIAAAIIVGGGGFLLGQNSAEQKPALPAPTAIPTSESPPKPSIPAKLDRADLIGLAAAAANAFAAGNTPESLTDQIDGKRFELKLPFGCDGPADKDSTLSMRWRYDKAATALRLHVAPMTWGAADWGMTASTPTIKSIEGFWIERPWTSSENCPAVATTLPETAASEPAETVKSTKAVKPAKAAALPEHTLAIGQVFEPGGGRADQRDGKPYAAVVRVKPEELNTSMGLRLRLTGRIARLPTGGTISCHQPEGSAQRPVCLIGALVDEVAIENPVNGAVLATWRTARR